MFMGSLMLCFCFVVFRGVVCLFATSCSSLYFQDIYDCGLHVTFVVPQFTPLFFRVEFFFRILSAYQLLEKKNG